MNHTDFFTKADYEQIKRYIDAKKPFEVDKNVKKQCVRFRGHLVPDDARHIWNGDYIVHIGESHNDSRGWGGFGYATDEFTDFASYDSFVNLLDKILSGADGYEKADDCNVQISLF